MKKNIKIVEINGLRGIFLIAYAIICAAAGFILFPAWVIMSMWNWFGVYVYSLPHMNLVHGFILYAIIVLIAFATKMYSNSFSITSANLTKSNIAALMKDIDEEKQKGL